MRSSRPDLQTGKAPQTSTESVDPYAAASSSGALLLPKASSHPLAGNGTPPETPLPVDQSGIPGGVPRIERRNGAAALTGAWIPRGPADRSWDA